MGAAGTTSSPLGRASRRWYWTYVMAEAAVWITFGAAIDWFDIDLLDRDHRILAIAAITAVAASLVLGALIGIMRLHDTDRSGWYLILCVLPFIGWLAAATLLNAPGTPGPNRYGP